MAKTKILYLITRFIRGGADDHVLLTVKNLDKRKYDIHLGFGEEHDLNMVNEAYCHAKVFSFPMKHFSLVSAVKSIFHLYKYMKKHRIHIVHTNSTEAGIAGRIAAWLAGVPIILHTVHGIAFVPSRSWALNQFILFCERFTALFTTRITPVGNDIKRKYLRKGIGRKEQYKTIYGGIDFSRFTASQKLKSKPVISHISRLAKGKGHDVFLKAAKKVLRKKSAEFWIVGDGEYKSKIQRMVRDLDLQDNVKMLGYRRDIPNILGKTSILVLPSLAEGIPRVIMEALRMKVPVIATPVGGVPEILDYGKAGVLIPTNDPDVLADGIIHLLNNPQTVKALQDSGYRVSERFSVREMITQLDLLYEFELKRKNIKARIQNLRP